MFSSAARMHGDMLAASHRARSLLVRDCCQLLQGVAHLSVLCCMHVCTHAGQRGQWHKHGADDRHWSHRAAATGSAEGACRARAAASRHRFCVRGSSGHTYRWVVPCNACYDTAGCMQSTHEQACVLFLASITLLMIGRQHASHQRAQTTNHWRDFQCF